VHNGHGHQGNGRPAEGAVGQEVRWIEIDLSDLGLPADMPTLDHLAAAASHVYERFVPYADEGWEWVTHPGSREFHGWVVGERAGQSVLLGARLLSRRAAPDESPAGRPAHGISAYRTRQLTGRPWTAEPGSKLWKPFSRA
jgi:hypothetical protein